jgi:cyclic-di-AMP phosphodiesterase PgpH
MLIPGKSYNEKGYSLKRNRKYFLSKSFHIVAFGVLTFILVFIMVVSATIPEMVSFDISEINETGLYVAAGVFLMILLFSFVLVIYMNKYTRNIITNRNSMILLYTIILLTLFITRSVYIISPLMIPVFIAPLLISLLLDTGLAIVVNFIIASLVYIFAGSQTGILYMGLISGTFAAFTVSKAKQRSKLSASGLLVGALNVFVIVSVGIINRTDIRPLVNNSITVFVNGIISIILTIGLLPFFESTFNVITPVKLLELANPNQPLLRKLLLEAPGTYHHSLMVGNLAEVAAELIGANTLLARVGAYYHDIGKLKRPGFFKENQMTENPHDKMTPNLSTLVITSHTGDGLSMAAQYKIPPAVKDIIVQHHGTTLVAYFYHKAKKLEKDGVVKLEDFRYEGPKPASREAALVMLADSVEAAVRSMPEKTEGKIEGLVRKIIKDKLDDGQLEGCSLTLKDLDSIARGFMQVFGGLFHQRENYPDIMDSVRDIERKKNIDPMEQGTGIKE